MQNEILVGDALAVLKTLPSAGVDCVVTSPPYYGLRDYGVVGQIGLEQSPQAYVYKLVEVFRECGRVLKDEGTLWLNLGDSYNCYKANTHGTQYAGFRNQPNIRSGFGLQCKKLKNKDLIGIPWRVAFALQADGWYLRQDIIWHKPNPMPESVTDRCTKAHEYIFLLSKRPKYYFDHKAIMELAAYDGRKDTKMKGSIKYKESVVPNQTAHTMAVRGKERWQKNSKGEYVRNKRSVWTVETRPFSGAHFATFPPDLIRPCVLAGCPVGGIVLDPFFGAGTVGVVAKRNQRHYIGIELNPGYAEIAKTRIGEVLL